MDVLEDYPIKYHHHHHHHRQAEQQNLRLPEAEEYEPKRRIINTTPSPTNQSWYSKMFPTEFIANTLIDISGGNTERPETASRVEYGIKTNSAILVMNASNVNTTETASLQELFYRHSLAMTAVYCVAYLLVFAIGLVGNCFVIAVVFRTPRMRTVTNFFIVNLAVADILVIIFCLPATLMSNIFVPTYAAADKKLQELIQSNLEKIESSVETTASFTIKSVERELESSSSDSEIDNTRIIKRPCLKEIPIQATLQQSKEHISPVMDETPSPSSSMASASLSAINASYNKFYHEQVLAKLTKIETEVENHSLVLNEILRTNRKINIEKLIAPSNLPIFPITSLHSFIEFEEKLKEDSIFEYMIKRLAAVGGANIQAQTRRILYFLLSDEVAMQYNWKGRDKLSFEKTLTMKVIYESAKLNFPPEEKNDFHIAQAAKDWLKFAKTRFSSKNKNK